MQVALIEFFVTEQQTFVFVIDPRKPETKQEPWVETIEIEESQISAGKNMIEKLARHPLITTPFIQQFQKVGQQLLTNALEYIGECDILYIIPHKELHYFPFHAIEINGQALCESYSIVYLPNASLLKFCQANNLLRKDKNYQYRQILTMGVGAKEDLPSIRKKYFLEIEKINQIFQDSQLFSFKGIKATKRQFLNYASESDLIHIASHGYFDNQHPLSSGPVLAFNNKLPSRFLQKDKQKYILEAQEFYQLRLKANLAVFSGCMTGMSDVRPGDELMGLVRGVLAAGIPSMILSLWEAHHQAAIDFMTKFYKELKQGHPKAIAFQKAQSQVRNNSETKELKYWASFILIGDWL